ncbi:MAG: 16S rRNA processing protein RimM [bacterium]|nr:16S rRNA processing protein RimM [bacterium]
MTEVRRLELGRLVRPVGLRGEMRFLPDANFWPLALTSRQLVLELGGGSQPAVILRSRPSGNCLILKVEGIQDRNASEDMRNAVLVLIGEPDVDLPDEPLPFQVIGLKVIGVDGEEIGEVIDLQEMPAQALLRVKMAMGECAIPFVDPIVRGIDWDAGQIEVDPPEGLLDL